ncbi:MAG: YHYH protein [Pelagimonas sp.]|jgi:hypothetical protein|nr:YHYH protein [Pelagimonas sp.]
MASAQGNAKISRSGTQICITSNGLPDHARGQFPNRGNPHRIKPQRIKVCVPANPKKGTRAQQVQVTGIARNGVIIRPGTADYYDARSPRGHSRNRASGWNLDGMGARRALGLDNQNAHVDRNGIYHYHGMPPALETSGSSTLMGWAADGFEIHYSPNARPSWQLRSGRRPSAPGGRFDGTYNEDFEYRAGSGNLDQCNGAMVNGRYVYFATDAYPFFPRCLYGTKITRMR